MIYTVKLTKEEYNTIYNALLLDLIRAATEHNTAKLELIEKALTALQMGEKTV